jgi:hypothetical protein
VSVGFYSGVPCGLRSELKYQLAAHGLEERWSGKATIAVAFPEIHPIFLKIYWVLRPDCFPVCSCCRVDVDRPSLWIWQLALGLV